MVYEGHEYPETHIADLVRYSIREYGKGSPKGFEDFQKILQHLNLPKGLLGQQKTFLPKRESRGRLQL